MASEHQVVLCTVPDATVGQRIADALVMEQLAACVNLLPGLTSCYVWRGEAHNDPECLLIIKTRRALFARLRDRITELHPYEVPEVIALDVTAGSAAYLAWINENTRES